MERNLHALRDCPKAMQFWMNMVPERIISDFFSMNTMNSIYLNLHNWVSYWVVGCHSL